MPTALLVGLGVYFALQICVRLSLPNTLELDEAEQVFLSQWLQPGYGPQPPLWNWMQTGLFAITGPSVQGLSLLKNLLLFLTYVFYWMAADRVLDNERLKVVAVLALLTLPQVSLLAQQDLTHTVALLAATALFLYALFRILTAPDTGGYVLLGLAAGIGFLAKYNFVLLPVAAMLSLLLDRDLRNRVLTPRILLAVAIAVLIIAPHGLWLVQNLGMATAGTLAKMKSTGSEWSALSIPRGISSLIVAIVAFCAVTIVIFLAIFRADAIGVLRTPSTIARVIERMLMILLAGILLVIVMTGATHVRERWLDPFLLVLPLYLCIKIETSGMAARIARKELLVIPVLIMAAIPAYLVARVATAANSGAYTQLNLPIDRFTQAFRVREGGTPDFVVASDRHLAGNLRLKWPRTPVLTTQYPEFVLPIPRSGRIVLVWRTMAGDQMPAALADWAQHNLGVNPAATDMKTVALPYHYGSGGDVYKFGYAVLSKGD